MGKYDFEEEPSDSDDADDFLQGDIAQISSAFFPSKPTDADDDDDDDDDDDLELLRNLKEKYGVGDDISNPMSLKPLTTLPPVDSDDDEDDFETLRAIQRRFSEYGGGGEGSCAGSGDADVDDLTQNESEIRVEKSSLDDATCINLGNEPVDACINDLEQGHCSTSECEGTSNQTSSFPESAKSFIEAIKKNRSCQKFLRSKLLHIEARMEEIKNLRTNIKTVKDYQVNCRKVIGRASSHKLDPRIQLISLPKQRPDTKGAGKNISPMCYGPVENAHVASLTAALKKIPLLFETKKWSNEETENLEKGMVQQLQKMLIEKSADASDDIISSVGNLKITPEIVRAFAGNVNWEELASSYLPRRSGAECEARWLNHEDKLINKGDWTSMEEKQLLHLIQHYGLNNWGLIAEKLNTNRTPFKCLEHYQRSLNANILKSEWTEDEDAQLRCAVERYGDSNWTVVADSLEGRTGTQCSNRWNKTLHPDRKKVGKWSDDEDKRLKVAAALFGHKNWHKIAQFVSGRTQAQCRERWVNVLDPSLKRGAWSEEEDLNLKAAIVQHDYCWSRIAICVPSRTDNQCRRRWKKLFPHEVPLLQAVKRIQKKALISNFVGRESERPAIGPNDFVQIEGPKNVPENENLPQKQKKSRKSKKSDPGNEAATRSVSNGTSKKRKKRTKSPEIETSDDNDDAVRNNGGDVLTCQRRRVSKRGSKQMMSSRSVNVVAKPEKKPGSLSNGPLKKRKKRAKSPENETADDNDDAVRNNGGDVLTCKRRRVSKRGSKQMVSRSVNVVAKPEKISGSLSNGPSKKRKKRAKSPENETADDNDDAVRNNGGDVLACKRRRISKRGSKQMVSSRSVNVVAKPEKIPGNTLKKARTRDCGNQARSPEIGMTSDVTDAERSDGEDVVKNRKRLTRKSDSKKRTPSGSTGIATKCKKKSSENKISDGTEDIQTWDMPIKTWSRRAREVCSKDTVPLSGGRVGQAMTTGTKDTNKNTTKSKPTLEEEINDPEIHHNKPSGSNLEDGDIEDGIPTLDNLTEKASSSKPKPKRRVTFESSEQKNAKRNKLQSDESEKWEDLPLAALMRKGSACKQRKSKTTFRHLVSA